jgi:GTPase SAR1 family protein
VIWDIYGNDDFQKLRSSYLRGASGYLLVADGTRRATLNTAEELRRLTEDHIGRVPFVLAVNKADCAAVAD